MQTVRTEDFWWNRDCKGEVLCVRYPNAMQLLESLEPDKKYDIEIKRHRERRSLDANAYCWVLLGKLAAKIGAPKQLLYREYIRDVGDNCEPVRILKSAVPMLISGWEHNGIGWVAEELPSKDDVWTSVLLYKGSSMFDTAQMSRLIELIIADCKDNGIETLPPSKLAVMMEEWGK